MAPDTRWLLLPLALGVGALTTASAAGHRSPMNAYHQEFRTATRADAPQAARTPAWGACCEGQAGAWRDDDDASQSRWWAHHRPDPNRRRADADAPDGGWPDEDIGWNGWHGSDEHRGWRAGWRGAAPGHGGVWWYGWGGDWPAYAGSWERSRWDGWGDPHRSGHRGGFHGEFGFEHGWGGGHRVIALPTPRGD